MSASGKNKLDTLLYTNADVLIEKDAAFFKEVDESEVQISSRIDKRIIQMIRYNARKETFRTIILAAKRIVAVFLIVCTIGFTVCMSVGEVRAQMLSIFMNWYEEFVEVFYVSDKTPPSIIEEYREPCLQLTGTEKQVITQDLGNNLILYFLEGGPVISYHQMIMDSMVKLDSENCVVNKVTISGYDAQLFIYEDGSTQITWHDNEYAYVMHADSGVTTTEMLILIAESVYANTGITE